MIWILLAVNALVCFVIFWVCGTFLLVADRPTCVRKATAQVGLRRTHRLHLAMTRLQKAQRPAARKHRAVPQRPEAHVGSTQRIQVQRVHAFRRRYAVHARQMLAQQGDHGGMGQVVALQVHAFRGKCGAHYSATTFNACVDRARILPLGPVAQLDRAVPS